MSSFSVLSFDYFIYNSKLLSSAVSFIIEAASLLLEESFQRILANPSGDKTEHIAFSNIQISSVTPRARAPPLPPSPITIDIVGTF